MLHLRIGEILEERELTTSAFAGEAGIAYNTALALRRGSSTRIDLPTLEKICVALKVTPADLFKYQAPGGSKRKA